MKTEVIGHSFKADFGSPYQFKLDFHSETAMSFTQIDDDGNQLPDEIRRDVDITRVEIRPNVYMVTWTEPFNGGTTVTHLQDFENQRVWTNITMPDLTFLNMNGPLTPVSN